MLIYFKKCCVDIIYRLLKQKKETKKLQKNTCCWYVATKVGSFFSAVYMYFTFTKMEYISFVLMTKRHVNLVYF